MRIFVDNERCLKFIRKSWYNEGIISGLYAKWGSGKSLLLAKMKDSMSAFSRSWLDGVQLTWSWSVVFSLAILTSLVTLIATAAVSTTAHITIVIAIPILGAIVFLVAIIVYGAF